MALTGSITAGYATTQTIGIPFKKTHFKCNVRSKKRLFTDPFEKVNFTNPKLKNMPKAITQLTFRQIFNASSATDFEKNV